MPRKRPGPDDEGIDLTQVVNDMGIVLIHFMNQHTPLPDDVIDMAVAAFTVQWCQSLYASSQQGGNNLPPVPVLERLKRIHEHATQMWREAEAARASFHPPHRSKQ